MSTKSKSIKKATVKKRSGNNATKRCGLGAFTKDDLKKLKTYLGSGDTECSSYSFDQQLKFIMHDYSDKLKNGKVLNKNNTSARTDCDITIYNKDNLSDDAFLESCVKTFLKYYNHPQKNNDIKEAINFAKKYVSI